MPVSSGRGGANPQATAEGRRAREIRTKEEKMSRLLIWKVRETQGGAVRAALSELASQSVSPQSLEALWGDGPKAWPSISVPTRES